jgi:thymidylate synthase ThyX
MTISAKIITDSFSPDNVRLTTMQLRYPKFIHGEFMTHRVFSRNASSSRAIPVERLIKDVIEDPVYPSFWGKNQKGMQAAEENSETVPVRMSYLPTSSSEHLDKKEAWDVARERAVELARAFAAAGYHKQIVNRLLEPFCHINVVVTATEWSNFFALRCHPDAQPEMRELAEKMRDAMSSSKPRLVDAGEWHLPYVSLYERDQLPVVTLRKISTARCARVSYLTQDGRDPNMAEDLALYNHLVGSVPLHASPAEHQATPADPADPLAPTRWKLPLLHGNFIGWIQNRKLIEKGDVL